MLKSHKSTEKEEEDDLEKENHFEKLPDELLILIFCHLTFKSRLECRRVCRKWLLFLDGSSEFQQDRHLFLHHCLLGIHENPVLTLMKSQRDYYSLKMGRCCVTGNFDNLTPFFERLGKTVTYLDLTELKCDIFGSCFVIFERFRKLKTLKLGLNLREMMWKKMVGYLEERNYARESDDIEELVLADLSGDALLFEMFLKAMPRVKSLSILSLAGFVDMPILLEMHGSIIKNVGPNVITIYHSANRVAEDASLKTLVQMSSELQLESIDCGWRVDSYNASSINCFLNKQKMLKNVTLECYGDIPCDIWTNVTKLIVRFDDTITSFAKLAPLIHLKSLDFCISESYRDAEYREIHPCFFGHEVLLFPNLTYLSVKTGPRKYIYMTRDKPGKSCHKCWETMLKSFPSLTSLKFCHHKHLPSVFELLLERGASLQELTLINLRSLECLLKQWKPMPHLRHLELWQATRISLEGMTNLCKKSPNLRHLRILGAHLGQPDHILKSICMNLPDLEILEIDFDSPGLTKHAYPMIYLLKDLKILGLGNHEKAQLSRARQMSLFEHLPLLKVIHDIGSDSHTVSRIEFLELVKNETSYKKLMNDEYLKQSKWSKIVSFIRKKNH